VKILVVHLGLVWLGVCLGIVGAICWSARCERRILEAERDFRLAVSTSPSTFALDVDREARRAARKHRPYSSLHEGYAVLLEEVDEFWDEVRKKEAARDSEAIREELVQIAAVACRIATETLSRGREAEIAEAKARLGARAGGSTESRPTEVRTTEGRAA
jgi:NTP pyrophosphatase (non-canonical NTP hydrolase)